MRTQVGIVGAGPAGLMLAHLLHLSGIESVIIESRSREAIEATIRAGVLEQSTVDLMRETGLGDRLQQEGFVHRGIAIRFNGQSHRIDFHALTGGRTITVYPQHEVLKDLIEARLAAGGTILFGAKASHVLEVCSSAPRIRFTRDATEDELACDFAVGADGSYGVCRQAIPESARTDYVRIYPLGWFGILAKAPPSSDELIYTSHERGFVLISTRTHEVQRMYFQCDPAERVEDWTAARIWEELQMRMAGGGFHLKEGEIFQKDIIPLRSFVSEPMQYGRLFLAGDAAHTVPPTGAKGLNLAIADADVLALGIGAYYSSNATDLLDAYSATALSRVWRAQHFSYWMTSMLHRFPDASAFDYKRQLAELELLTSSPAAQTVLAQNYVGLKLGRIRPPNS
ncbi:MAG: 4-hydroxybenzoate 3-monooxygenase [Acetobacteraceae bacterium]